MVIRLPFPDGHRELDTVVESKGIIDASTKGKKIRVKAMTEADILEVRDTLLKEVKRQNAIG